MHKKYKTFQLLKHMQRKDVQPNNSYASLIFITYINYYIQIVIHISIY